MSGPCDSKNQEENGSNAALSAICSEEGRNPVGNRSVSFSAHDDIREFSPEEPAAKVNTSSENEDRGVGIKEEVLCVSDSIPLSVPLDCCEHSNPQPSASQLLSEQLQGSLDVRKKGRSTARLHVPRGIDACDSIFQEALDFCEKMKKDVSESEDKTHS